MVAKFSCICGYIFGSDKEQDGNGGVGKKKVKEGVNLVKKKKRRYF